MSELTLSQEQNAVALSAKAMTQDKAQAYELVGMIKAFDFTRKLVTVTTLKSLQEIKESKRYKDLELTDQDGKMVTVTTFRDFCTTLGFSGEKIDQDLLNLNTFGEEFFETSQRLGLGYREMRKLRQLPEEARAEIIDADYSEATDKEELLEKIEDLTAKHAKEKETLQAQLKRKSEDYEAQAKVLANKNERINKLDMELAKKTHLIDTQTPDQRGEMLREETAGISYKAEAILRGQVWQAFEALSKHSEETGIDHRQFMSGVLAEYQLILSELKSQFNINDQPSDDDLPDWAKAIEYADEIEQGLAQIIDEVSNAKIVE
ncbi:hypothetical protein [Actinobacillus suis]|uniref:hypothetical protein n=1 Tax=Actinobacillus suis TaxID=716 RepID=UPI000E30CBCC|nr:hypothetical protein [Actinobacillus suis]